jgi:hypothetical protein
MYDTDADNKHKLKEGTDVVCEVKRARNVRFHKKFFALLRLVLDNLPDDTIRGLELYSEEAFLLQLKEDMKLYHVTNGGVKQYISISFAAMDDTAFERFYSLCVKLITTKYLPGVTAKSIEDEIYRFT